MRITANLDGTLTRQTVTLWQVRRINDDGILDNHKRWLVKTIRHGWGEPKGDQIMEEVKLAKQLVLDNYNDPLEPLTGNGWQLEVDVVEFEVKGQVAVL